MMRHHLQHPLPLLLPALASFVLLLLLACDPATSTPTSDLLSQRQSRASPLRWGKRAASEMLRWGKRADNDEEEATDEEDNMDRMERASPLR